MVIDALAGDRGLFFDPQTGAEIEHVQWADTDLGLLVRAATDDTGCLFAEEGPLGLEVRMIGEHRPFRFEPAGGNDL